jgi:HK97 family phage major capsid protein
MSTTTIKKILSDVSQAWHELTSTNDSGDNNQDPLIINKLQQINNFIDKQHDEISKLRTVFSRPSFSQSDETKSIKNTTDLEYKSAFCNYIKSGNDSALNNLECKSSDLGGINNQFGYSITTRMSAQIFDMLTESSAMRKLAKIDEISYDALELIEDNGNTEAGWSRDAEILTNNSNITSPTKRMISVHELYAQPKVTQRLLDDPRIDVEDWIAKKLIDAFAKKEGSAFINGDGDGKPRGILSYKNGKNSGQIEQITSSTKDGIVAEDLIKLLFSLKEIHAVNAKFLMSRSAIQAIRMLKDGASGRYLWSPSINIEIPNTILGVEVVESPDMPELKSGNIVAAFADFKRSYQIVDKPGIKIIRDPYTGKPYVKYYALKRVGGDVVNFDAIKLLNIA